MENKYIEIEGKIIKYNLRKNNRNRERKIDS